MAWRKPTEDDIVATLSREELEAFKTDAGLTSDQWSFSAAVPPHLCATICARTETCG